MSLATPDELVAALAAADGLDDEGWEHLREALVDMNPTLPDLLDWGPREQLTTLALGMSLCPIHFCDYAICFDDGSPACAAVRTIHPGHDT